MVVSDIGQLRAYVWGKAIRLEGHLDSNEDCVLWS